MKRCDPKRHHRRSIRLQEYDYSQEGAYFVTVCAHRNRCTLGHIVGERMRLNPHGEVVVACWEAIPQHFPNIELDVFVVMPNHVHGIVVITEALQGDACVAPTVVICAAAQSSVGARHAAPEALPTWPRGPRRGSIGAVIGSFKSAAARRINRLRRTSGPAVWQRNYHEHTIRNEESLNAIREYLLANPAQWAFDRENPERVGPIRPEPWEESRGRPKS